MKLEHTRGSAPYYLQIANLLREKIESKEYPLGSIIPSEKELEEQYAVSRITIRQAVTELERVGYVKRERGRGTSVTYSPMVNEFLMQIKSFTNEMKDRGITPSTKKAHIEKQQASAEVAKYFKIKAGDPIYLLHRVRCAYNEPLVIFDSYLSCDYHFPLDDNEYQESMYDVFEKIGVSRPKKVKERYIATLADERIASELDVNVGSPIFRRERISYGRDGKTIEYTICYYRGDRYVYSLELNDQ